MKTIFFTGKGGVGKSTLSAATAWQLSKMGKKVLAVSFDPAHNLGDIFGLSLSDSEKKFTQNLYLTEINLEKRSESYIRENISLLESIYSYLKPFNMDRYFQTLKYSPGIEEYASLTAMEQIIRKETQFDFIVFDTPPTGLTLRILALPEVTLQWIDRLKRIRREILEKRYTIHKIQGEFSETGTKLEYDENDDRVMKKLKEIESRYEGLKNSLQGKNNSIVVVFNPDFLSLRESQRLIAGLQELKMPLRVLINNKLNEQNQEKAKEIENQLIKYDLTQQVKLLRIGEKISPNQNESYIIGEKLANLFLEKSS